MLFPAAIFGLIVFLYGLITLFTYVPRYVSPQYCYLLIKSYLLHHPSVTFMYYVKMSSCIFKLFSPLGSHTILVFQYQMLCQYSDGKPPICGKNHNFWPICAT